ncbi:hypothetical protein I553_2470 [Mycobacterium xenopi 4042]|uniref:Uncharacterized protein n=1 Tax=Mycobacterium xenopi 4042 TaxID=1299334 RepID=X8C891_MYCXE|nr:hypothetical protein I553_2470 [Mycobacterium xenopi 4042]
MPHDFYLRKVLGFTPTINQAFGYGRGIHNLLREVHSNPQSWSAIAGDRDELMKRIQTLIDRGLFYLRHTTGAPAENMKRQARKSSPITSKRTRTSLPTSSSNPSASSRP